MSKKTTAVIKARRKVLPTAGVPAGAPARPVEPDEVETATTRLTNPHATGVVQTPVLKSHVAAAQKRAALRKKAAQKRRSSK
jgi:hypothetical protein